MQDNSTPDTTEMLIRYMDGELDAAENARIESLLQTDASAREQYQFFLAAKGIVRSEGLRLRVAGIQRDFIADRNISETTPATNKKRTSFFTPFMNIAAVLVFLLVGYGTFQYLTITSRKVYDDAYISYQLPVNRGEGSTTRIDELYNDGDYKSVINSFNTIRSKTQKDYFLAGLSYLQLNDAKDAVQALEQVEVLNASADKKGYVQQTDYYLMLAYIKAGEISKAEKKLDKIRSDKAHLFYENAGAITHTQLMILKWKEK